MTFEVKKLTAAMLAVGSLTVGVQSAQALPTIPSPLEGRTITGARVDAYDPSAVMEYDPNLNITWLRDWDVNGVQSQQDALVWAGTLHVGVFANWSLPSTTSQDGSGWCYFFCDRNQFGYLYFIEMRNAYGGQPLSNTGPFINVQPQLYWASGENFLFYMGNGYTFSDPFVPPYHLAVAVRDGDVAAIPEPETWAMMLMGLAAGAVALRKRT